MILLNFLLILLRKLNLKFNHMAKKLPTDCPSCGEELKVKVMHCGKCNTLLDGNFDLPQFARLNQEDQSFILNFVKHSGSLKQMSKDMHLSYPTVRNLLDEIIKKIESFENTLN